MIGVIVVVYDFEIEFVYMVDVFVKGFGLLNGVVWLVVLFVVDDDLKSFVRVEGVIIYIVCFYL